MVRFRLKFFSAISRSRSVSRSRIILPECSSARHIGHATLVSGFVGAALLHPVSPLAAVLASVQDDDVDLSQAKSALRVLAALGDGITGAPWLKGAAGLGLEIVNALDVSLRSRWSDVAYRLTLNFLAVLELTIKQKRLQRSCTTHLPISYYNAPEIQCWIQ